MNHAGEIRALTAQVRPHVALITAIAPAHLEFFPSVEAIADAKGEIFEGLEPGGVAVLNRDSEHYARLRAPCRAMRGPRGSSPSAAIRRPTGGWRSCASRPSTARSSVIRAGRQLDLPPGHRPASMSR